MMWQHFTDRGRKIIQLANQEAQAFNHEYIGTEHVMLALIKERFGVAAAVLLDLGLSESVDAKLREAIVRGPDIVTMGRLPQTPRLKKAVENAMAWARKLQHGYVGTEHLLLGLMDDPDNVVTEVVKVCGSTPERVQLRCLEFVGHEKTPPNPEPQRGGQLRLSAIGPILFAVTDGKWVRLVDGKLEIRDELPPIASAAK